MAVRSHEVVHRVLAKLSARWLRCVSGQRDATAQVLNTCSGTGAMAGELLRCIICHDLQLRMPFFAWVGVCCSCGADTPQPGDPRQQSRECCLLWSMFSRRIPQKSMLLDRDGSSCTHCHITRALCASLTRARVLLACRRTSGSSRRNSDGNTQEVLSPRTQLPPQRATLWSGNNAQVSESSVQAATHSYANQLQRPCKRPTQAQPPAGRARLHAHSALGASQTGGVRKAPALQNAAAAADVQTAPAEFPGAGVSSLVLQQHFW
jgi:hypothetical protein